MYTSCTSTLPLIHRQPAQYEVNSLPVKVPPSKELVVVTSLPMLGYLEQSVATSTINALSAVGAQKPKFPFLNSTNSALIYFAYHLKGEIDMHSIAHQGHKNNQSGCDIFCLGGGGGGATCNRGGLGSSPTFLRLDILF